MKLLFRWPWLVALGVGLGAWALAGRSEVGAWIGGAALANVEGTIARAKAAGITRLDLFVNDASDDLTNGPIAFHVYDHARVSAAVAAFQAAGLRVSLSTWATPRADWLAGMRQIGALAASVGADELIFDLEEPWTVLRHHGAAAIAAATRDLFDNVRAGGFTGKLGVTCIVSADLDVLGPALKAADLILPQAYASARNTAGMVAGELERRAAARYQPFKRELVLGLAAFVNPARPDRGLPGYGLRSPAESLGASLAGARSAGVRRVRLWWLPTLDAAMTATVSAFAKAA